MKYIKYFEAKTSKQSLKDFCEMYLAYLLDDETYKLKVDSGMSHTLNDGAYWHNGMNASKTRQSINVRKSPRFDTIILSRENVKKLFLTDQVTGMPVHFDRYDRIRSLPFIWNEIKDQFIPFFIMLDRRYRVVNITFTDGKNIKGVRKEDIEKDIPFMSAGNQIKQIYITVRK
jgi:hypothetical protein